MARGGLGHCRERCGDRTGRHRRSDLGMGGVLFRPSRGGPLRIQVLRTRPEADRHTQAHRAPNRSRVCAAQRCPSARVEVASTNNAELFKLQDARRENEGVESNETEVGPINQQRPHTDTLNRCMAAKVSVGGEARSARDDARVQTS